MMFHPVTPLCINRGSDQPLLEEQICGPNYYNVRIERSSQEGGTQVVCQWQQPLLKPRSGILNCLSRHASENHDDIQWQQQTPASYRLYFPETQTAITEPITTGKQGIAFFIPAAYGRYCNLLINDASGWVLYARAVILLKSKPIFYDNQRLVSPYLVNDASFSVQNDQFELSITFTGAAPKRVDAILQTTRISTALSVNSSTNGLRITGHVPKEPEIWMLCVIDENQKFLAQHCLEVGHARIS